MIQNTSLSVLFYCIFSKIQALTFLCSHDLSKSTQQNVIIHMKNIFIVD